MPRFVTVAKTAEIGPGEREILEVEGCVDRRVQCGRSILTRFAGVCTHDDGPIGEGELYGYEIECPASRRASIFARRFTRMPAVRSPFQVVPHARRKRRNPVWLDD